TTTNRSTPVQVSNLTGVTQVSGGSTHSLALKSDGTVWAWGSNARGRLGDNTTIDRSTPVQVVNLASAIDIAAGDQHSLALKSDGTVWAWGSNSRGELGNTSITDFTSSPVQVTGGGTGQQFLTGVRQVSATGSFSLVLRSDGTVWAWGDNTLGQLGAG